MNSERLKVLIIDPWGIKETGEYTKGLCMGVSRQTDLTLITNYHYIQSKNAPYRVFPWFFRISEKIPIGRKRQIIRGVEYVRTYRRIIRLIKSERYDVVHINWLLMYKADVFFLRAIKRCGCRLVYTAHNVIPHINGQKSIPVLQRIYGLADRIILHGSNILDEFSTLFSDYQDKVYIQKHGCNLRPDRQYDDSTINPAITAKLDVFSKRCIAFGQLDYNKGTDRLTDHWLESDSLRDVLLIVAGKLNSNYTSIQGRMHEIKAANNILFIGDYVPDNMLNYLITKSDLVLLPYRHASMSGVIFTASDFSKPVLCTNVGAFNEYIVDGEDCFFTENSDAAVVQKIDYVLSNISKNRLNEMGIALQKHISDACNWVSVTEKLVSEVYQ